MKIITYIRQNLDSQVESLVIAIGLSIIEQHKALEN